MSTENKKGQLLTKAVSAYMQKLHMTNPGDKVLVGLSGGADSVCLFYVLLALQDELGVSLEAVHINHMLRESALRDEEFVRRLCERERVPVHVLRTDVSAMARENRMSTEEAGRKVRYDFFAETAQKTGAKKIAVAHHMDDQAETILFHLCRGTGVDGLSGISPVRDNIIRPLLSVSRADVESYLSEIKADYMTDETNAQTAYSRNRIRHKVLPVLEKEVCEGAAKHIARTGQIVLEAKDYLQEQVLKTVSGYVDRSQSEQDCVRLSDKIFEEVHLYLVGEVIRFCIAELAGSKKDVSSVHVEMVQKLAGLQVGSVCSLPYGIEVKKSYQELIFSKGEQEDVRAEAFFVNVDQAKLTEEGVQVILPDGKRISFKVFDYDRNADIPIKTYTKWLDYGKIEGPLTVRTPMTDDFFYFNHKNKKYVKDYMVNEKIPAGERRKSILVAEGNHMLYFVGKRISNYVKIDGDTKRILEITVTGG